MTETAGAIPIEPRVVVAASRPEASRSWQAGHEAREEPPSPRACPAQRRRPAAQTGDAHDHPCQVLAEALAALPRRQRVPLLLRVHHHLSYAEIAAALRCSEDDVRASVYAGLRALRDHLGDRG